MRVHAATGHRMLHDAPQNTQIGHVNVRQMMTKPNLPLVEKVLHESPARDSLSPALSSSRICKSATVVGGEKWYVDTAKHDRYWRTLPVMIEVCLNKLGRDKEKLDVNTANRYAHCPETSTSRRDVHLKFG